MGEANRTLNGARYAPHKVERPVEDAHYNHVAVESDAAVDMVLTGLLEAAPGHPGAIAAGAIMALVRFITLKIVCPLGIPNVRAVFSVILPAANKAAEQIVEQLDQPKEVGQSKADGSP